MAENCSFCGRVKSEVKHLIQSEVNKNAFVCDKCVKVCKELLEADLKKKAEEAAPKKSAKILPLFGDHPEEPKPA